MVTEIERVRRALAGMQRSTDLFFTTLAPILVNAIAAEDRCVSRREGLTCGDGRDRHPFHGCYGVHEFESGGVSPLIVSVADAYLAR